ncbi:MAG: BamA/TamA family outer membrane protein [Porphyromonadaceae bacterium]|nr:BamA/TamA family outer membrane protein [Porphyromonadaceae bacterium]
MTDKFLGLLFILVLSLLSACSIRPYQREGEVLYTGVRSLKVEDERPDAYTQAAIAVAEAQLSYAPSNAIFSSSKYRWPLPLVRQWIYLKSRADTTGLGSWVRRTLGARPIWVQDVQPRLRANATQRLLSEYGFLRSRVESQVHPSKEDSLQAKISYRVRLGELFELDTVEYLPPFALVDSAILQHREVSVLRTGMPLGVGELERDRQLLASRLRDEGYYYFRPEYIRYEADTMHHDARVHLRASLMSGLPSGVLDRWRIGRVSVRVLGDEEYRQDLLDKSLNLTEQIRVHYTGKLPLRPGILLSRLRLRPDSLYRQREADQTLRSLSNLGAFSSLDVLYTPTQTDSLTPTGERLMDIDLIMRKDKPWDVSLEGNFKLKSTEFMGPGLRFSLDRRNLFGGGELLSTSVYGSYEWQTGRSPIDGFSLAINSYQLGADASLTFPSILFPGRTNRFYYYPVSTTFRLSGQAINRAQYYALSSFTLASSYDYSPQEGHTHSITPLSVSYNLLTRTTDAFLDILRLNPALGLSMQDQLIPQMSYSYTWEQAVGRDKSHHLWVKSSLSQAGNLTNLAGLALGKSYTQTKEVLGVPYAQFVKLASDLRYTYMIDRNQRLATRFGLGAVYAFGNMLRVPYVEQFFVGGASSIRAFTVRSLGPGSYRPDSETLYTFMDHVGEAKLELNAEYRTKLTGSLEGAVFVDAGNVWLLRPDEARPGGALAEVGSLSEWLNQIAVGTGVGLRYDLSYLVVRLDLGIGLHLPYETSRKGWYNIPRFRDALGIHLAIGYPF